MDVNDSTRGVILVGVQPGMPDAVLVEAARLARDLGADLVCAHVDLERYTICEHLDGSVVSRSIDPDLPDEGEMDFDADLAARIDGLLAGSGVMVCCVVGFPLGAMAPTAKAYEARDAVRQGAQEVDMVINIGALKSKDYETVFEDICRVVKASGNAGVKVILETSALDTNEKIIGCTLSKLAGAAFVKTSTGFGKGGATVEDVQLMRSIVGSELGVKASGGVRTAEDAIKMAQAGANRVGASASVAIVSGKADGKAKGY